MITNIIILICLVIFVYIRFISKKDRLENVISLGAFYPPYVIENHQYYRMLTCHFLHMDIFHFLMNVYAFYDLGRFFEAVLGKLPYIYLILISMLLSSLLCYSAAQISERQYHSVTFGLSGVVYGFFGAITALGVLYGGYFQSLLNSFLPVIGINVLYTLLSPGVSKTGHIGGFIGGVLGIVVVLVMQIL